MKIWPVKVKMPRWGICEVRQMTDRECNRFTNNFTPRSHGLVNLFQDGVYMGWCGIAFAKRRIVGGLKQKLPKYIRDIPI